MCDGIDIDPACCECFCFCFDPSCWASCPCDPKCDACFSERLHEPVVVGVVPVSRRRDDFTSAESERGADDPTTGGKPGDGIGILKLHPEATPDGKTLVTDIVDIFQRTLRTCIPLPFRSRLSSSLISRREDGGVHLHLVDDMEDGVSLSTPGSWPEVQRDLVGVFGFRTASLVMSPAGRILAGAGVPDLAH
ncbi:hypothetical protein B0H19DRAFT_1375359 [Mycena capillaripes]|nr:hypothetical protein B0H19DRAFT_1375359 [Mycena capillaripes]